MNNFWIRTLVLIALCLIGRILIGLDDKHVEWNAFTRDVLGILGMWVFLQAGKIIQKYND